MARWHVAGARRARAFGIATGALGALVAALAIALGAASATETAPASIGIENFAFDPPTLEVATGTTVRWVNHDDEIHAIASAGLFASPAIDRDETFSWRFETPGSYEIRCALHPQMRGTVVVR